MKNIALAFILIILPITSGAVTQSGKIQGATGVFSGAVTAGSFSGDGSGLTNVTVNFSTIGVRFNEVAVDTKALSASIGSVGTATGTLSLVVGALGVSTNTLSISTTSLGLSVAALSTSTESNKVEINALSISTVEIRVETNALSDSTEALKNLIDGLGGGGQFTVGSTLTVQGQDVNGYSVLLASGINTPNGVVTAKEFRGNGAGLTGVTATAVITVDGSMHGDGSGLDPIGVKASSVAILNAGGQVPASYLGDVYSALSSTAGAVTDEIVRAIGRENLIGNSTGYTSALIDVNSSSIATLSLATASIVAIANVNSSSIATLSLSTISIVNIVGVNSSSIATLSLSTASIMAFVGVNSSSIATLSLSTASLASLVNVNSSSITTLSVSTAALSTAKVNRVGDTMTGQLTNTSTITVQGTDSDGYSLKLSSGLTAMAGVIIAKEFRGNGALLTDLPASVGGVTGSGTITKLAKFTAPSVIGDSTFISEVSTGVTINGSVSITSSFTIQSGNRKITLGVDSGDGSITVERDGNIYIPPQRHVLIGTAMPIVAPPFDIVNIATTSMDTTVVFTSTGRNIFTVPPDVFRLFAKVWGGAGAGSAYISRNGTDGGGGVHAQSYIPVTAGQSYIIFVGSGGVVAESAVGGVGGVGLDPTVGGSGGKGGDCTHADGWGGNGGGGASGIYLVNTSTTAVIVAGGGGGGGSVGSGSGGSGPDGTICTGINCSTTADGESGDVPGSEGQGGGGGGGGYSIGGSSGTPGTAAHNGSLPGSAGNGYTVDGGTVSKSSYQTPAGSSEPDYIANRAVGGTHGTSGSTRGGDGNVGLVTLKYFDYQAYGNKVANVSSSTLFGVYSGTAAVIRVSTLSAVVISANLTVTGTTALSSTTISLLNVSSANVSSASITNLSVGDSATFNNQIVVGSTATIGKLSLEGSPTWGHWIPVSSQTITTAVSTITITLPPTLGSSWTYHLEYELFNSAAAGKVLYAVFNGVYNNLVYDWGQLYTYTSVAGMVEGTADKYLPLSLVSAASIAGSPDSGFVDFYQVRGSSSQVGAHGANYRFEDSAIISNMAQIDMVSSKKMSLPLTSISLFYAAINGGLSPVAGMTGAVWLYKRQR